MLCNHCSIKCNNSLAKLPCCSGRLCRVRKVQLNEKNPTKVLGKARPNSVFQGLIRSLLISVCNSGSNLNLNLNMNL
jgi:hypothetical protein